MLIGVSFFVFTTNFDKLNEYNDFSIYLLNVNKRKKTDQTRLGVSRMFDFPNLTWVILEHG